MARQILDATRLHPAIRDVVENRYAEVVHNVQAAASSNPVLVVGMMGNPYCRKARRLLDEAGVPFKYLGYGSYLSQWQPRSSLKMWTGWPTLPMVFVKGTLIGGADDLKALIDSGELKRLLGE